MPAPHHFKISNFKFKINSGFTLVELLIVVAIVAILSVIGVTVYTGIQKNARNSAKKADIDAIAKAYEVKYDSSGNYVALTDTDFASGKIPTPDGTTNTSYFVAGPNVLGGSNKNYILCASLIDNNQCFSNSSTCICKASSQGDPVDPFSAGNSVVNSSFETDSDGDGLADNWTAHGSASNTFSLATSPTPKEGTYSQKMVINADGPYQGFEQIVTGLKPSTNYKETAWMYLQSGPKPCISVGVGMQGPGMETFTWCDKLDQWVQLTLTGSSDALGRYRVNFQNWTNYPTFYVDGVRLEEVN